LRQPGEIFFKNIFQVFLDFRQIFPLFWVVVGKNVELSQIRERMFRGQFTYSIDSKGRIAIPAKLRKHISADANETFVMTRGLSNCIDLYPLDEWQKIEESLLNLNSFQPDDARFIRMFVQFAAEDVMDGQSRIMIPSTLITYAKIEKEVLILGALKKIEVWNPKIYEEYLLQSPQTYEEIAAKVMASK
jgi:MraZ protein